MSVDWKEFLPIKPERFIPPVNGEQLMNIAYSMLSADPLSEEKVHHNGGVDYLDENGHSKRMIHDKAMAMDIRFFNDLAWKLNDLDHWLDFMTSHRRYEPKQNGKLRPIDMPSEMKRLYSIYHRHFLQERANQKGYLEPTIVAFRGVSEFEAYRNRPDGITIQDIFAGTVLNLIRNHGPWVVSLDLTDAFGQLPHRAIHSTLKELGLNHSARRHLVALASIRTRLPDGKLYKSHGKGIEQGNPISPLIFNLVMSKIAKEMKKSGFHLACYGDDIIIPAATREKAREGFCICSEIMYGLGFRNIRPIGTEGKSTKIFNTENEPAELIKTFYVNKDEIGLTSNKLEQLKSCLSPNPSLNQIRKSSTYKSISKTYFKKYFNIVPSSSSPPTGDEGACGPVIRQGSSLVKDEYPEEGLCTLSLLMSKDDNVLSDMEEESIDSLYSEFHCGNDQIWNYLGSSLYDLSHELRINTLNPNNKVGSLLKREVNIIVINNGRRNDLRIGSEAGVTPGYGGDEEEHFLTSLDPVFQSIRPEDLDLLKGGKRLSAGNYYRPLDWKNSQRKGNLHPIPFDLRELDQEVPEWRIPWAIHQLARVGSILGRVAFLIHPGNCWHCEESVFDGLNEISRSTTENGLIIHFKREKQAATRKPPERKRSIPKTDLIVLNAKRSKSNARVFILYYRYNGAIQHITVNVDSINPTIARIESICKLIKNINPKTLALQFSRNLENLVLEKTQPRQTALSDAKVILENWQWVKDFDWLIGTIF